MKIRKLILDVIPKTVYEDHSPCDERRPHCTKTQTQEGRLHRTHPDDPGFRKILTFQIKDTIT